jgi:hypothetical protein
MNHLWVVEMRINGKWLPSVETALTRREALKRATWLRGECFPDDPEDFRVRKYVREEK